MRGGYPSLFFDLFWWIKFSGVVNQKFEDLKSGDVIRNLTEQNQKLQQVKTNYAWRLMKFRWSNIHGFRVQTAMKNCINFKTWSTLKCRNAFVFNFTLQAYLQFCCGTKPGHFRQYKYLTSTLILKKMGKILIDFCVITCNLWINVK